jgi:hypothetical protein
VNFSTWLDPPGVITPADRAHGFIETRKLPHNDKVPSHLFAATDQCFWSATKIRALFLSDLLFLQLFFLTPLPFNMGVHIYAQTHQIQSSQTCSKLIYLDIDV